MIIKLKTVCPEIIGRLPNGEYDVADGSSALKALALALESKGMPVPEEEKLAKLMYVINSHSSKGDVILQDGDQLMVLRPVIGG